MPSTRAPICSMRVVSRCRLDSEGLYVRFVLLPGHTLLNPYWPPGDLRKPERPIAAVQKLRIMKLDV